MHIMTDNDDDGGGDGDGGGGGEAEASGGGGGDGGGGAAAAASKGPRKPRGPAGARPAAGSSHRPARRSNAAAAGSAIKGKDNIASNLNRLIHRISQPFVAGYVQGVALDELRRQLAMIARCKSIVTCPGSKILDPPMIINTKQLQLQIVTFNAFRQVPSTSLYLMQSVLDCLCFQLCSNCTY